MQAQHKDKVLAVLHPGLGKAGHMGWGSTRQKAS